MLREALQEIVPSGELQLRSRIVAHSDFSVAVSREITAGMYRVVTEGERSPPDEVI